MKKTILILTTAMLASLSLALEWDACIKYITRNDPTAKPPILQDDGQGVYIKQWNSTVPQPTTAELEAAEAEALAWKAEQDKAALADLDTAEEKLKLFLRALVKCVNKRLPAGNKITETELKQEARALLDE